MAYSQGIGNGLSTFSDALLVKKLQPIEIS
jgi:hypothetical protein